MPGIRSVLHIDDDDDIVTIVRLSLGLRGVVAVRAAHSMADTVRIVETEGWTPDVVLLDVRLGGDSSLDILERLRMQHPMLPVIVLSAAGAHERPAYAALGVKGFITKPFDPLALPDQIDKLLA